MSYRPGGPPPSLMARALSLPRAEGVLAGLTTVLNVLLLNALVLFACAGVVTVPLALRAGWATLERWRDDGEDRVAREFLAALRAVPIRRSLVVDGTPLVLLGLGVVEVRHFAADHRPMGLVCLGLAFATVYVATGSFGYVVALDLRSPATPAGELWTVALRLALVNALVTGPLCLLELVMAVGLVSLDPATLVAGVPLAFLWSIRSSVAFGMRRVGAG